MANPGDTYSKTAKGPLERFKHQNALMKQFGEDGLRAYTSIEEGRTAADVIKASRVSAEKFDKIIEFMLGQGMVSVSKGAAGSEEEPARAPAPAPAAKKGRAIAPVEDVELPPAPEEPGRIPEIRAQKKRGIKPVAPDEEEAAEARESGEEARAPEPEEEAPAEEEAGEKTGRGEEGAGEEAEEERAEKARPGIRERRNVRPAEQAPEEEAVEEKGEAGVDIGQLSPLEKIIYNKFGKVGVDVYALIDGERTAEEILSDLGISEVKLVEILEFMDKEGIIRLEKPEGERAGAGEAGEEEEKIESDEPALQPMVEQGEEIRAEEPKKEAMKAKEKAKGKPEAGAKAVEAAEAAEEPEPSAEEIVPMDIPAKLGAGALGNMITSIKLMMKHKNYGKRIYSLMNGKRDVVELVLASGFQFYYIDLLMAGLVKEGRIKILTLTRDEVRSKYGPDGFAVYKRYGRDGILIYELIGKVSSLPEIVSASGMEPQRVVEIFMFIHRVLGLELPLNREMLYKQLGLSPPAGQGGAAPAE